jgi:hypothetical protein
MSHCYLAGCLSLMTGHFWILKLLQSYCWRWWLQAKDTHAKRKLGCLAFILLLVNSWAQIRSHCFSTWTTFKYLLQFLQRCQWQFWRFSFISMLTVFFYSVSVLSLFYSLCILITMWCGEIHYWSCIFRVLHAFCFGMSISSMYF